MSDDFICVKAGRITSSSVVPRTQEVNYLKVTITKGPLFEKNLEKAYEYVAQMINKKLQGGNLPEELKEKIRLSQMKGAS